MTTTTVPAPPEPPAPRLTAHRLTLAYDGRAVVHDVDLEIRPGEVTVVVGANGCGKSTLLRGLGRLLRPVSGQVRLGGGRHHRAASAPGGRGGRPAAAAAGGPRGHHGRRPGGARPVPAPGRVRPVVDAPTATSSPARSPPPTPTTSPTAGSTQLSGGQRQRVWIAMVLAQDPRIMLLDEPTTYLDIAHQVDVLDLLDGLNRDHGTTVVMVLHDLNLAARYAQHLVVMCRGRVLVEGAPAEVLTEDVVQEAFGLACRVVPDPVTGTPLVVPGDRRRAAVVTTAKG